MGDGLTHIVSVIIAKIQLTKNKPAHSSESRSWNHCADVHPNAYKRDVAIP